MKAILVDDEKHVRDAVRILVDWQHYGIEQILEAPNGQIAMELIAAEKPEIIVTDMMMPVKNGVELMEWIHTNAPTSKTIVISGHDDFSLLRHTVKYGGMDYILKPIDAEQLNDALGKAIDTWRKEEETRCQSRERNIEMNQLRPVYWDKLLSKLVAEPSYYEAVADQLDKEFEIDRTITTCRVAILSLDTMEQSLKNKFANNLDLLFFSLINICNEFLRAQKLGIAFRNGNTENEIILLLTGNLDNAMKLLNTINDGMKTSLRSKLDFGIGETHPFPAGITLSYRQAYEALRNRNLLIKKSWVHCSPMQDRMARKVLHFSDFEERIRLAIRSGSSDQVNAAIQLWMDSVLQQETITLEQLHLWWNEYSLLRRRWVQEFFPAAEEENTESHVSMEPDNLIIPLDEQGILSLPLWQEELTRSILFLTKELLEHQQKDHKTIFDIAKYVENHYHEDLTLQDIANQFYLSREYISRKFKQEFKVNLSDYLGKIRIDKAKMLLLNPHLRISQIADMVGYQDEKYFSKVFKKNEGLSPNEYRKQM
ncbi:putative response regulatory protein [compost metagenome]